MEFKRYLMTECFSNNMFEDSRIYIEDVIQNLENKNLERADANVSMMEAHLPMDKEAQSTNRIVSRYTTLVYQYCDEDYNTPESARNRLLDASQSVKSLMNQETEESEVSEQLREIQRGFEFIGEAERVDEDSAWGKIVTSMLEK